MLGTKQEALSIEMGGDWNQKKISLLEVGGFGKEVEKITSIFGSRLEGRLLYLFKIVSGRKLEREGVFHV